MAYRQDSIDDAGELPGGTEDFAGQDDVPVVGQAALQGMGDGQARGVGLLHGDEIIAVAEGHLGLAGQAGAIADDARGVGGAQAVQKRQALLLAFQHQIKDIGINAVGGQFPLGLVGHGGQGQVDLIDLGANALGQQGREVLRGDHGPLLGLAEALP